MYLAHKIHHAGDHVTHWNIKTKRIQVDRMKSALCLGFPSAQHVLQHGGFKGPKGDNKSRSNWNLEMLVFEGISNRNEPLNAANILCKDWC